MEIGNGSDEEYNYIISLMKKYKVIPYDDYKEELSKVYSSNEN